MSPLTSETEDFFLQLILHCGKAGVCCRQTTELMEKHPSLYQYQHFLAHFLENVLGNRKGICKIFEKKGIK